MRPISRVILICLTILTSMASAYAQSPREELAQLVARLQKTPADNALREQIIRLAREVKPAPAVPQEAEKFEGRAEYAFRNAKTEADFSAAAKEYENAIALAPWVVANYFNLGVAQEKAGKLAEAKGSFGWYVKAVPDAADAKEVRKRIAGLEFGIEQAAKQGTAVVPAPKPVGADFSGGWDALNGEGKTESKNMFFVEKDGDTWIVRDRERKPLRVVKTQGRQLWIEDSFLGWGTTHWEFVLSTDGQTIDVAEKLTQSPGEYAQMQLKQPGAKFTDLGVYRRWVLKRNKP